LQEEELLKLHEPMALRIIIAIRSDRMSLLHQLKSSLPQILEHCYELRALSRDQAEDAILNPAYDSRDYETPTFDFTDETLDLLLDFLSSNGKQDIESFQMQILCDYIEKNVVERQGRNLIEPTDIENPGGILETYYSDKIDQISNPREYLAARRFIEEGLVFEEEERRLTLFEGQIQRNWGVSMELLLHLENTHLIRREPSLRGGYTYELSHDTLVLPVLKAKAKRLEEERLLKAEDEEIHRNAELNELKKRAENERMRAEKEIALREEAQLAQERAEQILDKIYFYQDRYGLAYDKKSQFYGFIDKQLNTAINFAYKEALPFDDTGFARVKKHNGYFLVNVLGKEYSLASSIDQYRIEKTAIDLRNTDLISIPSIILNEAINILLLDDNCLNILPVDISRMVNLVSFSLSSNQISRLPKEIGFLQNLQTLRLDSNKLESLPLEIGNLKSLISLIIFNNQLHSLPTQIGNLVSLETLDISTNHLGELPTQIGQLKNLKILNLSNNTLEELPTSIGDLTNLTSLNLFQNYLTNLPPEIGNLNNLEALNLSFNDLTSLPNEIFQMKTLKKLDLYKNPIDSDTISRITTEMPWCVVEY